MALAVSCGRVYQGYAQRAECLQTDLAQVVFGHVDVKTQIGRRQMWPGFIGPLHQLEAGAGKDVSEAGFFPLVRIVEAIKVKVPDVQRCRAHGHGVRLNHCVGRALDAALNAECAQQVPHKGGLAGPQIAMQRDGRMAALGQQCPRQRLRKGGRMDFIRPAQAFYNGGVKFNGHQFILEVQRWAGELGFSQIGVAGVDLSAAEPGLSAWLAAGFHGDMHYMQAHGLKRARPAELVPGTVSVITARMDYLPASTLTGESQWQATELSRLSRPGEAVVSVYARGRDYHKVLRARLQKLAERIAQEVGPFGYRAFTDSAPVLEAELASRSGQGWRGKHTLVLNREAGSMFFLGEIYVDLELPASAPVAAHCGSCSACIDVCPTQAIIAPHRLDARRCISYLTIEHAGAIPIELRPLMGNRIYGCDDCQLVCPWNKFAQRSALPDFDERAGLTGQQLTTLFAWNEADFLRFTEGSPIRRIGHERWLRNVAVALGNALKRAGPSEASVLGSALSERLGHPSALLQEHVRWALAQAQV